MQRPLPAEVLRIVAVGPRKDEGGARRLVPLGHRHQDLVARAVAAAPAAELALEIEQVGVVAPAGGELPEPHLAPVAARAAHGREHVPAAQVAQPDRVARPDVRVSFHHAGQGIGGGMRRPEGDRAASPHWLATPTLGDQGAAADAGSGFAGDAMGVRRRPFAGWYLALVRRLRPADRSRGPAAGPDGRDAATQGRCRW